MLSQITPIAEASRGQKFGRTATWFILGAVVGGATLGVVIAGGRRVRCRVRSHERDDRRAGHRVLVAGCSDRQSRPGIRAAVPSPAGERRLADALPPVGLRRRLRLADRLRPLHVRHDGSGRRDDRPRRTERQPRRRLRHRCRLRAGPGYPRCSSVCRFAAARRSTRSIAASTPGANQFAEVSSVSSSSWASVPHGS